jgi:thiamine-phosphate pyrophosphorylase
MTNCDITLYGILDPNRSQGRDLADLAIAAAKGGATILQYRDKNAPIRELIEKGRKIKSALSGTGVPLLINDRVDAALAIGADGVHIGQDDMSAKDARQLLGRDAIIGLTIKTAAHAKLAPVGFLDYVCIGGVYNTLSKDNAVSIGIDGWWTIASYFRAKSPSLPIGAIAGIDASNIEEVIQAGADGVAIISAMFMVDDVESISQELIKKIMIARGY